MIKLALFCLVVAVVLFALRRGARPRAESRPRAAQADAERMVECAYCGVNHPLSESFLATGRYYCCAQHRQLAQSRER